MSLCLDARILLSDIKYFDIRLTLNYQETELQQKTNLIPIPKLA